MKIIPAILEKDLYQIKNKLDFFKKIKEDNNLDFENIQIDICDGIFVENITWLPEKDLDVYGLFNYYKKDFSFEYHLMCKDIMNHFSFLKDLNSNNFVIHIDDFLLEKNNKEYFLNIFSEIEKNNKDFILTANTKNILKKKDLLLFFLREIISIYGSIKFQIMGIDKIGVQGQKFNINSLSALDILKDNLEEKISFQIDGGVNEESLKFIKEKDVNNIVVGSYLSKVNSNEDFINKYNFLFL